MTWFLKMWVQSHRRNFIRWFCTYIQDKLHSFSEPLIHSFNKGHVAEHHATVFNEVKVVLILSCTNLWSAICGHIQDRTNILLLGDSTGDVNMIHGFPNARNYIKIGFLNYKVLSQMIQMLKYVKIFCRKKSWWSVT